MYMIYIYTKGLMIMKSLKKVETWENLSRGCLNFSLGFFGLGILEFYYFFFWLVCMYVWIL